MNSASLTPEQRKTAEIGMAWWNSCSEPERLYWLKRANSAVPADAYETMRNAPVDFNYCRKCTPAGIGYCRCEIACNE